MAQCLRCARGHHSSCRKPCDCSHDLGVTTITTTSAEVEGTESNDASEQRQRRNKPDNALKDQQSTGRKRAAKLYPLDREALCEWWMLPEAGGGVTIQGCGLRPGSVTGLQQSRHHGPDYNTLNNEPGNVHRICHSCHNSWHAVNDPTKDQRYLELYGARAGGENFKNSKVLERDDNEH